MIGPIILAAILFLAGRLVFMPHLQPTSDVPIYAHYAAEQMLCAQEDLPFYQHHAETVEHQIESALAVRRVLTELSADVVGLAAAPGGPRMLPEAAFLIFLERIPPPPVPGAEMIYIEYPPLACAAMRLPTYWMSRKALATSFSPAFIDGYVVAYRWGMAVVDMVLFVVVLLLVRRLYAGDTWGEQTERIAAYLAGTLALWPVLYDRLDLPLSLLVVLALLLLVCRVHYACSFAVLALAVNYKIVPLVLAPIWVVGALPAGVRDRTHILIMLAARSALLLAMIALCFLPFYLSSGDSSLGFIAYHRGRGLEISSLYSSLLMALHSEGQPLETYHAYGGVNVRSPLAPFLGSFSLWLAVGLLLAATVLLLAHFRRLASKSQGEPEPGGTLAHRFPGEIAGYCLLFSMLFIAANKVFSPQYLLGLAPLVALVPFGGWGRRLLLWSFVLICALTTLLFPFLFWTDLAVRLTPTTFTDPTPRGLLLLGLRNAAFIGLTGAVAWGLHRRRRAIA